MKNAWLELHIETHSKLILIFFLHIIPYSLGEF